MITFHLFLLKFLKSHTDCFYLGLCGTQIQKKALSLILAQTNTETLHGRMDVGCFLGGLRALSIFLLIFPISCYLFSLPLVIT